jgi:hypothetical protein
MQILTKLPVGVTSHWPYPFRVLLLVLSFVHW